MKFEKYRSIFGDEELAERLRRIRHVALDMDGTIYMGKSLFDCTKPFLASLREMGITYSFLTNNPSRSIDDYLRKLAALGIEAAAEEMYTTSLAAIDYIRNRYPSARRLFLLGTPSMISEFEKAGFESTSDDPDDVPDAVKSARLTEIIALQGELSLASNRRDVGREFEVLAESVSHKRDDQLAGRTSQNKVVVFRPPRLEVPATTCGCASPAARP